MSVPVHEAVPLEVAALADGDSGSREFTATDIERIPGIVDGMRRGFEAGVTRSLASRRVQLEALRRMLAEQEDRLLDALAIDVGKPRPEAFSSEFYLTLKDIDDALKRLTSWAKPRRVGIPLLLQPGSGRIYRQPLGTVCIIGPWNYPVRLVLGPLVPALAAGNTVVVKPSEVSPTVAGVLAELIPQYLDPSVVAVVTGGAREATVLLDQRFDHIMYTGNGAIGRVVMTAAARHLTPVTLELGGCSPVIVAADANIAVAARRIAFGKFINAGQTCVAPNHVLVEESVEQEFLDALVASITQFYGDDPSTSPDYGRMVNERHHDRVMGLLADGGYERTVIGGTGDRATRYIAPTVLAGVRPDAAVMGQEIFGPVLPVIAVGNIDEAIGSVNAQDKPLALYAFSSSRRTLQHIVDHTSSGGMTLNHVVQHIGAPNLPLGGVGPSGMGAYNGETGFATFSHSKPVMTKPTRPDPTVLFPPYTDLKQKIVRRLTPMPRGTRRPPPSR